MDDPYVLKHILKYLEPKTSPYYFRKHVTDMVNFYSLFEDIVPEYKQLAMEHKKRLYYIKKYAQYVDSYENYQGTKWGDELIDYEGHPVLLDMMTSGLHLPFIKPSFSYLRNGDDHILEEVKEIIYLFPDSIHCNIGHARCRSMLTPLYFASLNDVIPIEVVEILLKSGSDKNKKIQINSHDVSILDDTGMGTSTRRIKELEELFANFN